MKNQLTGICLCCLVLVISSASLLLMQCGGGNKIPPIPSKITQVNDSIYTITIADSICFNWNKFSGDVERDSAFELIKNNIQYFQQPLFQAFMDTTFTPFLYCNSDPLRAGDLVFILLDDIKRIPLSVYTGVQFCVFDSCFHFEGLLEALNTNRSQLYDSLVVRYPRSTP